MLPTRLSASRRVIIPALFARAGTFVSREHPRASCAILDPALPVVLTRC